MHLKRWLSPLKMANRFKAVAFLLIMGLLLGGFTSVVDGTEREMAEEMLELRGEVKFIEDLGGPHYDLNGTKLRGDAELLSRLEGQYIIARGYRVDEASIFMKDIIQLVDYEKIEQSPVTPPVEDEQPGASLQARNNIWENRLVLTLRLAEQPEEAPHSNDFELSRAISVNGQSQEAEVIQDHDFSWDPHERRATFVMHAVQPALKDQEVRISITYGEKLFTVDFPVVKIMEWKNDGVVSERKEWTITFNTEIDPATVNGETIFVTGTDGSPLFLNPYMEQDGTNTVVKLPAPAVSYTRGAEYYLYITDQVQAAGGAPLSHNYRMTFQIEALQPPPAENDEHTLVLEYTFDENLEGWDGCFAELPVDYEEDIYRLEFGYEQLPQELGLERRSLYISSNNASDDVFMFIKRQVGQLEGLEPHTTYQVRYELDLATNAPTGAVGIGGPPGEAVYVKVGASLEEPQRVDVDGFYEMNIDKGGGNKSEGRNALLIGNIAKKSPEYNYDYEIKTLDNLYRPLEITTDESGKLWLLAGTDSGFEGTTSLYYTSVKVFLTKV